MGKCYVCIPTAAGVVALEIVTALMWWVCAYLK